MKYLVAFLMLFFMQLKAQNTSKFAVQFGGSGNEEGRRIVQTNDNGYAIIGSSSSTPNGTSDMCLIKLDSAGFLQWEKFYGNNGVENGYSLLQLKDSGFILAGNTYDVSSGYDFFIVRTNFIGDTIWTQKLGGLGWDFLYDISLLSDSTFIVVGSSESDSNTGQDAVILKLDYFGTLIDKRSFGGLNDDEFKSVKLCHDSNLILTGNTKSFGNASNDIMFLKLNNSLDSICMKVFGGLGNDVAEKIIESNDSTRFYIIGSTDSRGGGMNDFFILTLNLQGDTMYSYTLGSYDNEIGYGICQDVQNNIALVGLTEGPSYHKILIRKNDVNTNFIFQTQVSGFSSSDAGYNLSDAYDIINTKDSGYVLVGKNRTTSNQETNFYVVKFNQQFQTATDVRIIDKSTDKINLMPNAIADDLYLSFEEFGISEILVYNITGVEVLKSNMMNDGIQLNMSRISSGIYVLNILDRKGNAFFQKVYKK